jgi:hypothetical protein
MSHGFGQTRWKRFAAVLVPALAATAALGFTVAQGALAASFFVSGQPFQVSAARIDARGVSVYPMVDVTRRGTHVPVVVIGSRLARVRDLCQSVVLPIPVLGPYTLRLTAGDRVVPATARNLFIDATDVGTDDALVDHLEIGVAAGALTAGPVAPGDRRSPFFDPDVVAQQGSSAVFTNVRTTAVAVSAGTFDQTDLHLHLTRGAAPCF